MTMPRPVLPIIAFSVPVSDLDKWVGRGANTVYYFEAENPVRYTKAQYEAECAKRGIYFITQPGDDLKAEAAQPFRLGWAQPDEPGNSNHRDLPGSRIPDYVATYQRLKAAGPNVQVWGTFSGSDLDNLAYDGRKTRANGVVNAYYHNAADGGWFAGVDCILLDKYLSDRPDWSSEAAHTGFWELHCRVLCRAAQWSGGKPVGMILETNDRGTRNPCPAWLLDACLTNTLAVAAINGVKLAGCAWFSLRTVNGWGGYDGTSADGAAMITAWNQRLAGAAGSTQNLWLPIPPLPGAVAKAPDATPPTPVPDPAPPVATPDATAASLARIEAAIADTLKAAQDARDAAAATQRDVQALPLVRQPVTPASK